jgi:IS5 family transposase
LCNDEPHKKCHKDIDARWIQKNKETFYGYKNHAKVDTKSKFINTYVVAAASSNYSQALGGLLDKKDEQKNSNEEKLKTRARVVCQLADGFMEQSMNGLFIRSVGIVRATGIIGLINLTYNLFRYEQTLRLKI